MSLRNIRTLVSSLGILTAVTLPAGATDWIVHPDGSGDAPTIWAAVNHLADGDTVSLGDGTFSGSGNWDINLVNRTLLIRSLNDDPLYCEIDCFDAGADHRAFFINGGNMEIRGIEIKNGRADRGGGAYIAAGQPTFRNVWFRTNHATASGGAVHVAGAALPRFYDGYFRENTSDLDAGALALSSGANATLNNCSFLLNEAVRNGGTIYATASGAEFFGCRIAQGWAGGVGGALFSVLAPGPYFEGCTFFANGAEEKGGGIFCTSDSDVTFSDVCLVKNFADQGGAIYAEGFAVPDFDGCTITGNTTVGGAAIYCASGAAPVLDRSIVAWNRNSAAFDEFGAPNISFSCCDIFGNDGGDWVNGIEGQLGIDDNFSADPLLCDPKNDHPYLAAGSPCLSENSSCGPIGAHSLGCDAPTYYVHGDAGNFLYTIQDAIDLAPSGSTIKLVRTYFSGPGNRDLDFGGKDLTIKPIWPDEMTVIDCEGTAEDPHRAFVFKSGETQASTLERLTIRNGYAPYDSNIVYRYVGGGIMCVYSSFTMIDCRIENCYADWPGGGVYAFGTGVEPIFTGCVFEGNESGNNDGGGLRTSYATPQIIGCEFRNNVANAGGGLLLGATGTVVLEDCLFDGNSTSHSLISRGGGLYIGGDADLDLTVTGCTIRNNDARRGGGVYLYGVEGGSLELTFLDCTVHSNSVIEESEGGGIHVDDRTTVHLDGCDIRNNAALYGGGIFMGETASVHGTVTSITDNEAYDLGGGIYQSSLSSSLSLDECLIARNEINRLDGGAGAGLWLGATGGSLVECDITDNSLYDLGKGAGLYVAPGASLDLSNCLLSGNHADNDGDGGGLYVDQGTCWMEGGRFAANSAGRGGGLALNQAVSVFLDGVTLYENTANDGGAIFCLNSSPEASGSTFAANSAPDGGHVAVVGASNPAFNFSILAFSGQGEAVHVGSGGGDPSFYCTDIYGNTGGDWVGAIAPDQAINNNMNLDPLFCDLAANDFRLAGNSPCLPGNNPCGAQVGAWGEGCAATSVEDEKPVLVQLGTNHPNPFSLATTVQFALPRPGHTELSVYDASGRLVDVLVDQWREAGFHEVVFRSKDLPSGYYFCRLVADGIRQKQMMTLIK